MRGAGAASRPDAVRPLRPGRTISATRFIRLFWRHAPPCTVGVDRRPLLVLARRGDRAAPRVGDPPGLKFQRHKVSARLVPHAHERKTWQIRVEGVAVGVQVHRVEVDDRPNLVTEERQVQLEPGAEQNSVELLGIRRRRSRSVLDRCHPRPHRDSTLGHQRQVLLGQGDAGGEQRWVGRRRSVLLRASTGFDNDLLELSVDLSCGQSFVREGSVPREDPIVGRHSGGELRQDVALSALGDHDAQRRAALVRKRSRAR